MLSRPRSLVRNYSEFEPIEVGFRALVKAALQGQVDHSSMRVDIRSAIDSGVKDNPKLEGDLLRSALCIQEKKLQHRYAHNLGVTQVLSPETVGMLRAPVPNPCPLAGMNLQHGEVVVIDCAVRTKKLGSEDAFVLVDYPPFAELVGDPMLILRMPPEMSERLRSQPLFRTDWQPYCRILGRYLSLHEPQPALELFLLSVRRPPRLDGKLLEDYAGEWDGDLSHETFVQATYREDLLKHTHELIEAESETAPLDRVQIIRRLQDISLKDWRVKLISDFDNTVLDGPVGFWVGWKYFLDFWQETGDKDAYGIVKARFEKLIEPISEKAWPKFAEYLKLIGVARIDPVFWKSLPLKNGGSL